MKLIAVAWENSWHFATPPLVSPRNDVWWTSALNRVWHFCARSFLRRHFAGKPVAASWNVDCFQRLLLLGLGKKRKQKPWFICCLSQSGLMLLQVSNMDPSLHASAIGHLRVPKTLTFKVRLSAQHFSWKWVLFAWERKIISISKAEHLTSFWYRGPGELGTYCHWDQVVTEEARCF